MSLYDLNINQLKQAAAIKEQIEGLNKELITILGTPNETGAASTNKRTMSVSVKRRIAATQKPRRAHLCRAKSATRSAKPAAKAKKKFSVVTRATLSDKLKAYGVAKRARLNFLSPRGSNADTP